MDMNRHPDDRLCVGTNGEISQHPPRRRDPAPGPCRGGKAGGFAVFGNPISQSLSPAMHAAAFAAMGIAAPYRAIRVDDAAEVVRMVRQLDLRGASVTIPFKESVMAFLDEVDPDAREIGAVNTILNTEGKLFGYNTGRPGLRP